MVSNAFLNSTKQKIVHITRFFKEISLNNIIQHKHIAYRRKACSETTLFLKFAEKSVTLVSLLIQLCLSNCKFPLFAVWNCAESVKYAIEDVTKKLLCAFDLSRLDYCNSLLAGRPKYFLSKLQNIQNNAARHILRTPRSSYVTPQLHSLHWFPVEQRIEYKLSLLCMCFKIISYQASTYLSDVLQLYTSS